MPSGRSPQPRLSSNDRSKATYDHYTSHIAYEIQLLLQDVGSQKHLADELGFANGSAISRIVSGVRPLSLEKARKLDELEYTTSINVSFETLVTERDSRKTKVAVPRRIQYDVFLAAPMASAGDDRYKEFRDRVLGIKDALEHWRLDVYCAMDDIAQPSDFDTQQIAYVTNWEAIQKCDQLVLYLPTAPTGLTPSSVWVEVGMALARRMPCTFFVPEQANLPYVIQRACELTNEKIVEVYFHGDDPRKPQNQIQRNGPKVLAGGSGKIRE